MIVGVQERAKQTRRALVASALRLIARDGYNATSLIDIARDAHMAKGTVNFHFRTKAELGEVAVECYRRSVAEIVSGADQEPTVMRGLYRVMYSLSEGLRADFRVRAGARVLVESLAGAVDEEVWGDLRRGIELLVSRAQGAREIRQDLDAPALAQSLVVGLLGAEYYLGAQCSAGVLAAQMTNVLTLFIEAVALSPQWAREQLLLLPGYRADAELARISTTRETGRVAVGSGRISTRTGTVSDPR